MHGAQKCIVTDMIYEDVSMEEGGVGVIRTRPSITSASGGLEMPNMSPVHLRSTNEGNEKAQMYWA